MIKRRFYKQEHGDKDVASDSSSSSESELDAEASVDSEEEEDNDNVVVESRQQDHHSSSSSGYESEDGSANEVSLDSSVLLTNDDVTSLPLSSENNLETVNTHNIKTDKDVLDCVLKSKSVFKCKLCPKIVSLTEETLKAHLEFKRHGRSVKLLKEGRLKMMLDSDGEMEGETHQERHASTLALALSTKKGQESKKNKRRQRQRKRLKKNKGNHLRNLQNYEYLRGKILYVFPEYTKKAEDHLRKAVKLNPSLADAWLCLGNCIGKEGDLPATRNCFTLALSKGPNKRILSQLSMLERRMAQEIVLESIKHAKEAIAFDVKDGNSWYNLGNACLTCFFVTGAWDHSKLHQSLKAYQNAEKDESMKSNPDLYFNCATVNSYLENYERALSRFEAAASKDPS